MAKDIEMEGFDICNDLVIGKIERGRIGLERY